MFYCLNINVIVCHHEKFLSLSAAWMIILFYGDERMIIQANNGLTISKLFVFTFEMLYVTWLNIFACIFGLAKA